MIRKIVTLCMAVLFALAAFAAPVLAQPIPAGANVQIKVASDGRCLEVINGNTNDSAPVGLGNCNPAAVNQRWTFEDQGNGYHRIRNANSGKCLNVAWASSKDGESIVQYLCGDNVTNKFTNDQWRVVHVGAGTHLLVVRHSGKCLDGTHPAVQWRCHGASWQRWGTPAGVALI